MKKKIFVPILTLTLTGILVFSGYQIYKIISEYESGERTYDDLEIYVSTPSITSTPQNSSESEEKTENAWPEVDFEGLAAINPDIVGWIYSEGTPINYPIVHGTDNSYYLKHLYTGEYNGAGSIFLDSRNSSDFSDRHIVVYGHHIQNNSMFSSLTGYKQQEYYEAHPILYLMTPEDNYEIEVLAGYVASVKDDAWQITFDSEESFQAWIGKAIEKSTFSSNITPAVTDHIITLSTCSYEFDNARYVLVGILSGYAKSKAAVGKRCGQSKGNAPPDEKFTLEPIRAVRAFFHTCG